MGDKKNDESTSSINNTSSLASSLMTRIVSTAKFAVEIFDGSGRFGMWQGEVLDVLFQQGIDIAIEEKKPGGVGEEGWKIINRVACGTIRSYLAREQNTMNDHITSFNKLATDLRNMDVTFTDGDMTLMLLSSLPNEFEHLETTLLHGNDEVSLKEKGRCKSRLRLGKDECAFCREKGHWKKDCPKLNSKVKPNNGKAVVDSNVADCDDSNYSLVITDPSKSSDVEFEGKIIFPTQGSNEETTEDFPLKGESVEEEVPYQEPQPQLESIATGNPERTIRKPARLIDMVASSKSQEEIEKLKIQLRKEFEMKDLGEEKKILGMKIKRDRHSKKLYLSQKGIFEESTKAIRTPLAPHFKLSDAMSPNNEAEREYMSRVPYANAIGSLMYVMAVKWIPRYIHNTVDVGLVFEQKDSQYVVGYCDSDYAVALSTTEAEYMAIIEAAKEASRIA
uniref:CCHC-type domain-containing protein n=1 Tax=Solanum lycopersicum TaxID=4081 RepID=A0A3Q7HKL8_SOLLC